MLHEPKAKSPKKKTPPRPEDVQAAAHRRAVQQRAIKAQMTAVLKLRTPADVAEALGVSVQAVSGWKKDGKIATEMLLPLARLLGCRVDDLLTEGAALAPAAGTPTFEGPAPTVGQAIDAITSTLIGLTAIERQVARGAMTEWATHPEDARPLVAKYLGVDLPASPPTPAPKTKRSTNKQAAEKKSQPATLSVIPGGGNKSQLALPLQKAVNPSRNPFDESNASSRERDFYEKWTAPRAAA